MAQKQKKVRQAPPSQPVEVITQEQAVLRVLADIQNRLARIEAKLDSALAANPMIPVDDVEKK